MVPLGLLMGSSVAGVGGVGRAAQWHQNDFVLGTTEAQRRQLQPFSLEACNYPK
jgi:hypothetical protein